MQMIARVLATLLTFIATFYFVLWIPAFIGFISLSLQIIYILFAAALMAASAVSYFIWQEVVTSAGGRIYHALKAGIIVGAISLILGFFASSIIQGPLFGLFTVAMGPLGFLIGLIGGAIHWKFKNG